MDFHLFLKNQLEFGANDVYLQTKEKTQIMLIDYDKLSNQTNHC